MIKIKIKTLNPQRKIVAIEHRVTSMKMTSFLMTSFFQWINLIIKPQYKFAIFCENLKILCRVVSEILD